VRAFDVAHVSAAALAAFVPLVAFSGGVGLGTVLLCTLAAAAAAAIACLVCRWWPGLAAAGWRLWLALWVFNPVVLLALGYVVSQHECLLGQSRGWHCMGLALVVLASPLTLIAPTVAVIAHGIARRPKVASG
jgi:hypothetical protein